MAGLTREERTVADRLPDRVVVGLLAKTFPPTLVDAAVRETGAREQRARALPARLTVYFTLALWVWARAGYDTVLRNLIDGLAWIRADWGGRAVPTTGALAKARARLGWPVMAALFRKVAGPVGTETTPGAFWRGLRVCSMDGLTVDVPATLANEGEFGPSAPSAFPHVHVVAFAECATGAMLDAAVGCCKSASQALAERLARSARTDTLVLVGRTLSVMEWWEPLTACGASLLWRTDAALALPVRQILADGTYLSELPLGSGSARGSACVRVIEYTVEGKSGERSEPFTLVTTLTEPDEAPAIELAQLYACRWQLHRSIRAIKDKRAGEPDLRSKSPEVVYQETWALLCLYQAIRDLIFTAVTGACLDMRRVNFKPAV
jgi:hypothetical protein